MMGRDGGEGKAGGLDGGVGSAGAGGSGDGGKPPQVRLFVLRPFGSSRPTIGMSVRIICIQPKLLWATCAAT